MIAKSQFINYADQSVKVDRFFHWTNAYAYNHENLKFFFKKYYELDMHFCNSNIDKSDKISDFFSSTYLLVEMLSATNIYNDSNDTYDLGSISKDAQIYSYIVCYCYQWNLFESFVSDIVNELINSNKLQPKDTENLVKCKGKTKKMLDILKTLFSENPFEHILPSIHPNSESSFRKAGYDELDTIRKRRNSYVHSILKNNLDDSEIFDLQKLYSDDMWILRCYAQNLFFIADAFLKK